jgi:hypothetical protein
MKSDRNRLHQRVAKLHKIGQLRAPLPGDADVQLLSVGLRPIRVSQILRTLANTDFRAARLMDAAPSQVLSQVSVPEQTGHGTRSNMPAPPWPSAPRILRPTISNRYLS